MPPVPAPTPSTPAAPSEPLVVDVWSDVACPWCFVGSRNLRAAIATVAEDGIGVRVRWHAYELQPGLPPEGRPYAAFVAETFGGERERDQAWARVSQIGRGAGIDFRFDRIETAPNTRRAHRLVVAAQAAGEAGAVIDVDGLVDALFRAHFVEGKDIGHDDVLAALGVAFGLAPTMGTVVAAIDDPGTEYVVDTDIATAAELGVSGVPVFVCGGFGVVGAQPPAHLADLLRRAAATG